MSTASTTIIGTATILVRDVWEPLRGAAAGSEEVVGPSRLFTVALGFAAWVLAAVWTGSAALLLALGWAFVGPLASVVILGLVWRRTTGTGAFLGILLGIVSVLVWEPTGLAEFAHATWPGLFVPAIVTVVVSLLTEPPYYGKPGWESEQPAGGVGAPGSGTEEPSKTRADSRRTRRVARELTKPWTPFEKWNRAVERRGEGGYRRHSSLRRKPRRNLREKGRGRGRSRGGVPG